MELSRTDFDDLVELNRLRAAGDSPRRRALEARCAGAFAPDRRLAVYGSLAPGERNHSQLAWLAGEWRAGLTVRGEKIQLGWGAALGFSALRWRLDGPPVPVQVFVSDDLPGHWARLDAFEGPEYLRIVVPVYDSDRVEFLASIYAARETPESAP